MSSVIWELVQGPMSYFLETSLLTGQGGAYAQGCFHLDWMEREKLNKFVERG